MLAWSCHQEDVFWENNQISKIQLTPEEFMSIAYDHPRILSEDEVFQLVRDFNPLSATTKSSDISLKTKRKYKLGEDYLPSTRSEKQNEQIQMYEVGLNDGVNDGLAIVAADERVASVVAYIPYITSDKEKAKEQRENNLMLEFAELNLIGHLAFVDSIRATMRDSTVLKVSKVLGISTDEYSFQNVKNQIEVKQQNTENSRLLGAPGNINLSVDWGQDEPYNLLLKTYPDPIFPDLVTHHYPLGCAVTALMMVYSYFEPHMSGYDNEGPMTIDWKYLKENRRIINPDYGVPGDPEKRLKMVSRLGLWIYNGTKTVTTPDGNGRYSSGTTDSEIIEDLDLYGIAHDPLTIIDPTRNSSLQRLYYDAKNYPLVLMGGSRTKTRSNSDGLGSHVWVINGYNTNKTIYANMGWEGSSNGWYQISSDLKFDTKNGIYSTKFWTIGKLRNK